MPEARPDPRPDAGPDWVGASAALAERLGVQVLALEVVDAQALTPSMRRVVLTGDALADFVHEPGQDLMFAFPVDDGGVVRRRYTIRRHDAATATLTIDVVLHGDGPGARWATTTRAGDRVEAIGPRGKITVEPAAPWHLFVGDDSVLPAAFAMAETLEPPVAAILLLEVDGPADEQALDAPAVENLHWVHRGGAAPESGAGLVEAVRVLELPPGPGHAYLGGEMGVVARLRRQLADRGLARDQLAPKPYWRAGVANAAHGEPDRD
jgi:NADPH-dependent ferric siderophore reductase